MLACVCRGPGKFSEYGDMKLHDQKYGVFFFVRSVPVCMIT